MVWMNHSNEPAAGVLVLDKPQGITSHDVVSRVRRALGVRRVGHAGTLDPMATGVLVVAVGEATKLVTWLTAVDKSYEATIALGIETDTLDADGREVRRAAINPELLRALACSRGCACAPMLRDALQTERTRTTQVPPVYSAIKIGGERSFARARKGERVDPSPRDVRVLRLELRNCSDDPPSLSVTVDAGKGYYVRALARDVACALGTLGHLTRLRRTRSGGFVLDEAVSAEASPDELRARMQSVVHAAARALPVARLTQAGALDARCGRPVPPGDIDGPACCPCAWIDPAGALVAVGTVDAEGRSAVLRGFSGRG
jgi:tRNA pseudouridine55 synthase